MKKKIIHTSIKKSKAVIVIGGDGFMLNALKKFYKFNKPFYGINSGNYGFLMNKFSNNNFIKNMKSLKLIQINPLEMNVITKNNQRKNQLQLTKFLY